ncbi:MAG: hypothetical protein AABY07_06260, partial [Nanoarchaeota archaeon]
GNPVASGEIFVRIIAEDGAAAGRATAPAAAARSAARVGSAGVNPFLLPGLQPLSSQEKEILKQMQEARRLQKEVQEFDKLQYGEDKKSVVKSHTSFSEMGKWLRTIGLAVTAGELLRHSKLASTTLSSLFSLIGALIDTLLMPFIPLLIPVLKGLAAVVRFVMNFMKDPSAALKDLFVGLVDFIKKLFAGQINLGKIFTDILTPDAVLKMIFGVAAIGGIIKGSQVLLHLFGSGVAVAAAGGAAAGVGKASGGVAVAGAAGAAATTKGSLLARLFANPLVKLLGWTAVIGLVGIWGLNETLKFFEETDEEKEMQSKGISAGKGARGRKTTYRGGRVYESPIVDLCLSLFKSKPLKDSQITSGFNPNDMSTWPTVNIEINNKTDANVEIKRKNNREEINWNRARYPELGIP